MSTDTSERGLERLICTALTVSPCEPAPDRTFPWRISVRQRGKRLNCTYSDVLGTV